MQCVVGEKSVWSGVNRKGGSEECHLIYFLLNLGCFLLFLFYALFAGLELGGCFSCFLLFFSSQVKERRAGVNCYGVL